MNKELIERLRACGWDNKSLPDEAADALKAADKRIAEYKTALEEIRDSKYCMYENNGAGQYGIGVTDGHRYCSNIAREALEEGE